MNKNIYTSFALVACLVSAPLFADSVTPNKNGNKELAESTHRKFVSEEEERSGHIGYSGFEEKAAVNAKHASDTVTVAPSKNSDKASPESAHRKFVSEEEERSGHIGYSDFEENKAVDSTK